MAEIYANKLYLLEERVLPDGEWSADGLAGSDDLAEAIELAKEWADMEYDDDSKIEVRIVEYERRGSIRRLRKGECVVVSMPGCEAKVYLNGENGPCPNPVSHAEHWHQSVRYWCDQHTPWSGHFEHCGDTCKQLVKGVTS